jgi:hypothetical protein
VGNQECDFSEWLPRLRPPVFRLIFREGMNVLFTGTEKMQKIQTHIFAGLADAQWNQILSNAFLGGRASDDIPKFCKRFNCVLGVVVFPGINREVAGSSRFRIGTGANPMQTRTYFTTLVLRPAGPER